MASILRIDENIITLIMKELEIYDRSGSDDILKYHKTWSKCKIYFDKDRYFRLTAVQLWLDDNPPSCKEKEEWFRHCKSILQLLNCR